MLPCWDIARRRVLDVDPLIAHACHVAGRVAGGAVELELARLHRFLDRAQRAELSRLLSTSVRLASLVHEALVDVIGRELARELQVQAFPFARVLGPGDAAAAVHTDADLGHALDERNAWIALTAAAGTTTLQIRHLHDCGNVETPRVEPGDALLFTPVHVHGGAVHHLDVTRVSVDVRVAPRRRPKSAASLGARFVPLTARAPGCLL
jgi:hypothetical protein